MKLNKEIWIASGLRTPFAKNDKELQDISTLDLSSSVINKMFDTENINPDYVVWGTVVPNLKYSNIAREIVMDSKLDQKTIAFSTVLACSSSLLATIEIASMLDENETAIAGGVESMSNVQIGLTNKFSKWLRKFSSARKIIDKIKMLPGIFSFKIDTSARKNRSTGKSMGEHAEITGQRIGINKLEQDKLAVLSHHNYYKAKDAGFYDDLIFPAFGLKEDSIPRRKTSVQSIENLKPVFDFSKNGTITAGNSSLFTDGAAGV